MRRFVPSEALGRLNALVESRPLAVHISQRFALDDAARAHQELAGHHPGRMVLAV